MAMIVTETPHKSGISLGGIGTGSVELFPDGEFHYWQIANQPRWAARCHEKPVDDGDGDGLPDQGTRHNTYDAWDFSGTPAYKTVRLQPVQASLTVPVATCAFLATAVFEGNTCVLSVREGSASGWTVEGPEGYRVTVEDRTAD